MSQWVQYKNDPNGKKWELSDNQWNKEARLTWIVAPYEAENEIIALPRSEYVLVSPPEQWEDITEKCYVSPTGFIRCDGRLLEYANSRFTKIDGMHNGPAFIVERKRS